MLQNGQLMGPITIMTQPNNFAVSKSPPTSQQTSPSTTSSSMPPGPGAMAPPTPGTAGAMPPPASEGSPKLEVLVEYFVVLL